MELPILFSARLGEVGRIVQGADHDCLLAVRQEVGHLAGEGSVAALMVAGESAVHPDGRAMIDGREMQEDAFAVGWRGSVEGPAVPAGAKESGIRDAAGLGFRREGHEDASIPHDLMG